MIDSITTYAKLANVTLADRVRKSPMMTALNAATGIASEAGEINEIVKKEYFHEHPRTVEVVNHMEKELGDLVWYWALMCFAYHLDPADVLEANIEKLKKRYPDGFSPERSMNRAPGDI
jgi:NTP pyrophosphatase (non-canonical NTP hydrolase)